jgi:diacylglycerol O-acyltransferase
MGRDDTRPIVRAIIAGLTLRRIGLPLASLRGEWEWEGVGGVRIPTSDADSDHHTSSGQKGGWMARFNRLSAQDASFLDVESDSTPMVVAAVMVYDAKPLQLPEGGLDLPALRRHLGSALGAVPIFRRKLHRVAGFGNPVWIEQEDLDIDRHFRHLAVPSPGGDREFQRMVAWILGRTLDRDQPLWDVWMVEGLSENRFALVLRLHHAMVDGGAGLIVLKALHRVSPEPSEPLAPLSIDPPPSEAELVGYEAGHRVTSALLTLTSAVHALTRPRETASRVGELASGLLSAASAPAPRTSLNQRVGRERSVAWFRSDLAQAKDVKNALGGTVNDVVLAVCAGALRRHFLKRGEGIHDLTLRVACPADQRKRGGPDVEGNSTSSIVVDLPVHIEDPIARHRAIVGATQAAKRAGQSEATAFALELANRISPSIATRILELSSRFQNLVVSNVIGPPVPLYLMECAMLEVYPVAMLLERTGLGVTIISYEGSLAWCLTADRQCVPDVEFLSAIAAEELRRLHQLAVPGSV